ncbi:MAG: tetratricopeptide repeat protein [Paracoccaceae bacterium]
MVMWFKMAALSFAAITCGSAGLAEDCPAAPDHSQALQSLMQDARNASNASDARLISNLMWEYWTDAPNEQAQELLDDGMSRRAAFDFLGALKQLDALVEYCPDYAEGYNQRAFVNYLRHDFEAAIVDLDRALALSPNHIAAISGKALSHYALGELEVARTLVETALALNPWIPERDLVAPGGPLAPPGTDL